VDIVIHTAWRLDFNLSLASYEASIGATRRLIDLSASSPNASHIRFLFTSSIAVSQNWSRAKGLFPEESIDDIASCLGSGYGEGKYVVEQVRGLMNDLSMIITSDLSL
jgi:nucleoside-diphosphate-sugar epimerase